MPSLGAFQSRFGAYVNGVTWLREISIAEIEERMKICILIKKMFLIIYNTQHFSKLNAIQLWCKSTVLVFFGTAEFPLLHPEASYTHRFAHRAPC